MRMISQFKVDSLLINVHDSRASLGEGAAQAVSGRIHNILAEKPTVNIIFASAPSQNEFLAALLADETIRWGCVNAFHMDEYIGLPGDAPQGFGNFIRERLWGRVNLKSANYIDGNATDLRAECLRYSQLLRSHPIDIVCFGIGENGHLAFNDPPVADFADKDTVKAVELETRCRRQQVNDGCFPKLEDVPAQALTLTVPALMSGRFLYGMVPGKTKTNAVFHTLCDDIGEHCPATILRRHPNAILFVDSDSAAGLK